MSLGFPSHPRYTVNGDIILVNVTKKLQRKHEPRWLTFTLALGQLARVSFSFAQRLSLFRVMPTVNLFKIIICQAVAQIVNVAVAGAAVTTQPR